MSASRAERGHIKNDGAARTGTGAAMAANQLATSSQPLAIPASAAASLPAAPHAATAAQSSASNSSSRSSTPGNAGGSGTQPSRDDAILSVARVLHRHILLSRDEADTIPRSTYGSLRSTPRRNGAGLGHTPGSNGSSSIGRLHPFDQSPAPSGGGSGSWSTPPTFSSLGSPAFGSPYSSLSTPPQMPLDTTTLPGRGGRSHPYDVDLFDIDHYLARSYSVQVPLLSRVAPYSLFEQKRQYHVMHTPSVEQVHQLLKRVFDQARLNAECVIIALIYIERLMEVRNLVVTPRNWITLLTTALLSASKVWDDHSSFNAEFAAILPIFTLAQVNALERTFLTTLSYELYISSATYSQYYFGLRSIKNITDTTQIPRWYHAIGVGDSVIQQAGRVVEQRTGLGGISRAEEAAATAETDTSKATGAQAV